VGITKNSGAGAYTADTANALPLFVRSVNTLLFNQFWNNRG